MPRVSSLFFLTLGGCSSLLSPAPDAVARAYFEAASAGDEATVRGHVAANCQDRPVAKGAPAKVMWTPVKFSRLDIVLVSSDEERALVAYEYEGSAEAQEVDEKVKLFGKEVDVKVGGVSVEGVERSGQLELVREAGAWKIGC